MKSTKGGDKMLETAEVMDLKALHEWKVSGIDSSWIWLVCEKCEEKMQVETNDFNYIRYCVIPYLTGKQTDLQPSAKKTMDRFLKDKEDLIVGFMHDKKIQMELLEQTLVNNIEIVRESIAELDKEITKLTEHKI